jgi:hypothetical protein
MQQNPLRSDVVKKNIIGNILIFLHPDDVTHPYFVPGLFHQLAIAQDERISIVYFYVNGILYLTHTKKKK